LDETEVQDLGLPARGDEDVGRLDIPMNDSFGMLGIQGVGDLNAEI
jgi:hypothetical protein